MRLSTPNPYNIISTVPSECPSSSTASLADLSHPKVLPWWASRPSVKAADTGGDQRIGKRAVHSWFVVWRVNAISISRCVWHHALQNLCQSRKAAGTVCALNSWVVDSQFATIRTLNRFARIRPGFAMLLDILRFNQDATASPANWFAIRTDSQTERIRANPISIRTTPNANPSTQVMKHNTKQNVMTYQVEAIQAKQCKWMIYTLLSSVVKEGLMD